MKRRLLVLLLPFLMLACQQEHIERNRSEYQLRKVTDPIVSAVETSDNLYIPEDEGGWDSPYPSGRVGLHHGAKSITHLTVGTGLYNAYMGAVAMGSFVKILFYDCLIANGIPGETWDTTVNNPITRAGTLDYVVQGGIQARILGVTTYANGNVYLGRKKDEFYYSPTHSRLNAARGRNYSGMSFIWHGWGDNYNNAAIIPEEDGKYVIAVTLDYGEPNPRTALLPIRVTGDIVEIDLSAIEANKANLPTNYIAKKAKGKGNILSWEGKGYAYCIERDGQMIAVWQNIREYHDFGGNRNSKYRIFVRAQGAIPDAVTPVFGVTK